MCVIYYACFHIWFSSIGEETTRESDELTSRLSTLESELERKVATLHEYEIIINSLQNEKALFKPDASSITPQKMESALEKHETEFKTVLESPDAFEKIISDRDSIRNALVSHLVNMMPFFCIYRCIDSYCLGSSLLSPRNLS